jgi:RNA recognition motif-containing protein
MGRNGGGGDYSLGKRQREQQQARKQQDKEYRRQMRREQGPSQPEIVSAASVVGNLPSSEETLRAMENRAQAPRSVASIPCRLFVGGLGTTITEAQLREAFGQFGVIADAIVMTDRGTGQSRGFGFVTMQNRKDAATAVEALDGSELHGRRIGVNVATDRAR